MKKIFVVILCGALALQASAQTWQDALLFSQNNYGGTGRSMALGNAMTALGGDPGSLTLNPAGSAVASYSQLVITPGLSIAASTTQGVSSQDNLLPVGLGEKTNGGLTRFKMPNAGIIIHMPTGKRYGIKSSSLGLVVNSTADYTGEINASGVNGDNSFSGSLASSARGFDPKVMGQEDWFYDGEDYSRRPAWIDMTGYRAGLFDAVLDEHGNFTGNYVGAADFLGSGNPGLMGPLQQKYAQQTKGYKADILLNYALNWNDRLYLGANLGFTTLAYSLNEYWYEAPASDADFDPVEFEDGVFATFRSAEMKHSLNLKGTGMYFKLGALWRPVAGLRLGAAIQTPTVINLTERYAYSAESVFSGRYLAAVKSPEDEWYYALTSPFRANAGVAYTIGQIAAVSLDYEFTHYGTARFRYRTENDLYYTEGDLAGVNRDIRDALGAAHILRAGLEIKPIPALAFRAGYNYLTSPQTARFEGDKVVSLTQKERAGQAQHHISLGVGYAWGAFFADLAARVRLVPYDSIIPYSYYTYETDESAFFRKVIDNSVDTPMIRTDWTLVNACLTLGWRF